MGEPIMTLVPKLLEEKFSLDDNVLKNSTKWAFSSQKISLRSKDIKWSWACRLIKDGYYLIDRSPSIQPSPGDLALFRVKKIGHHKSIITTDNQKFRLYENDLVVGVFGNRYATDAFEGRIRQLDRISMLTAAGMIGTVRYKHKKIKKSTKLFFIGFLTDQNNKRINLKELNFSKSYPKNGLKNLLIVVGSGMNSGKTTIASKLINGLSREGLKVAGCKLTGSVSNRDKNELTSASAICTIDFSDYGFPSTYLCKKDELLDLFYTMLANLEKINPDVIIMEIADGILQRETAILLNDEKIKKMTKGILLAADSAPSALYSVNNLKKLGYKVIAVSGSITSSPLSSKEFKEHSDIQIVSSVDSGTTLTTTVNKFIQQ